MLWIGPPQDALFGLILLINSMVGIVQELKAKWTLDRLVFLLTGDVKVLRNGLLRRLPVDQIVIDDVLEVSRGDQIPTDSIVLRAQGLEVDESLVTGESEPVVKPEGSELLSGSFVVAGSGRAQAVRVGNDSYARPLAAESRRFGLARPEIREGIDRIIGFVTWLMIPTALLLVLSQLLSTQSGWRDLIASSVAGVVGIIPEGLVLLTSLALAAAVVRLGRWKVLVQNFPRLSCWPGLTWFALTRRGP
jgi:cation-transporting ATPase E